MEDENCSLSPDGLAQLLQEKKDQGLIVLDVRSFANFTQSHLPSSINLCLPTSLVKRKSFSLTNVESTISCDTSREKFQNRLGADIVLLDSDCERVKKNCVLSSLLQKFKEEQQANSVAFLVGGFQGFCQKFPQYCVNKLATDGVRFPNTAFSLNLPRSCILTTCQDDADKPCTEPVEIFDFLFVGDQEIASNSAVLERFQLTYILNTAKECPSYFDGNLKYHYLRLDLLDCATQNLDLTLLDQAFRFIDEAREKKAKVLVHCRAGQSRSATIVISYLIRTFRWTLQQAYRFVQDKRPAVSPNLGFMAQLSQFEKLVLGKSSNVHALITGALPTPQTAPILMPKSDVGPLTPPFESALSDYALVCK